MSFATNIERAAGEITSLLSFRPRMRLQDWDVVAAPHASCHSMAWDERFTVGLYDESFTSMDEQESLDDCEANDGSWFHDRDAGILYANFTAPGPNGRVITVEFDRFFATKTLNWFRDPRDSSSEDCVWHGGLIQPPVPSQGNSDLLFGYTPISVSAVQLAVPDADVLELLHEWSINASRLKIWQCAGPIRAENISEVFTGLAGNYSMQGGVLSIEITDPLALMNQIIEGDVFELADFPNIEPGKVNAPIRQVYGCVHGFVPVNIDYDGTPSTTVNRDWVVSAGQANKAQLVAVIDHLSGSNDGSHSKVDDASGFFPGDSIVVEQTGAPTYGIFVSSVNYLTNVITHTAIAFRTIAAGDEIRRGFIGNVVIQDEDGQSFSLAYEQDWTEQDFAADTKGFSLANGFEVGIPGFPNPFTPGTHQIYVHTYGSTLAPKKLDGITAFGPVADKGGAYSNPIGILWGIFRDEIRTFREVVLLDEASWVALGDSIERPVGFALPATSSGSFGTWADVIRQLLQCELLRLHILIANGTSTLTITRDSPTGAAAAAAGQEELRAPSWSWSYNDVYDKVRVFYDFREKDVSQFFGGIPFAVNLVSNVARYLHRVSGQLEMSTLQFDNLDAGVIAQQIADILSERRGILTGVLPASFTERVIGETITYSSKFLPGEAVSEQANERPYKLQKHSKSAQGVTVTLEDQKGIEDNAGDFA